MKKHTFRLYTPHIYAQAPVSRSFPGRQPPTPLPTTPGFSILPKVREQHLSWKSLTDYTDYTDAIRMESRTGWLLCNLLNL